MFWFKKRLDANIGKTVIHFITHGCMAQIDEFDYIGTIVDSKINSQGYKMYIVEVLKYGSREKRNKDLKQEQESIAPNYLQKFGRNLLIAYD